LRRAWNNAFSALLSCVFWPTNRDSVIDFEVNIDTLEFASSVFNSEAEALAAASDDSGGNAVVADGSGNSVTLQGVHAIDLDVDDFHIA